MKVTYYINEGRKKNLYCRIGDGAERVTFSLEHAVDPKQWDLRRETVKDEDIYTYTLHDFKTYIKKRYHELQNEGRGDILSILKAEAQTFLDGSGIEGIARNMFDYFNLDSNLPKYDQFVKAFEKFSGLKRKEFKVQTVGSQIHFQTDDNEYVMDTYEGLEKRLKLMIENRQYDEIFIGTSEHIWSGIYIDAGIEKEVFLPLLLQYWESHWNDTYKEIGQSVGSTAHLDPMKAASWRRFLVYMECYDNAGDAIKLAWKIDQDTLYPLSVMTMMNIFDADTCYSEYCEHEFYASGAWESISTDDNGDGPVFYIKPYEF